MLVSKNGVNRARKRLALTTCLGAALIALAACNTPLPSAPPTLPVYDSTASVLPTNVSSEGFEAISASELGDEVVLAGSARTLDAVTLTVSDWSVATDPINAGFCVNNPGRCVGNGWTLPMTLRIYAADHTNSSAPATGPLLGTVTQTQTIPFRQAADPTCTHPDGTPALSEWRDSNGDCFNGLASNITFTLSSLHLTVPNDIVWSVAYNTTDHGYAPLGGAGGPYDGLNVSVGSTGPATIGTDANLDQIFFASTWDGLYTDGGAGGHSFRVDTGWAGLAPQIKITAH